MHVGMERRSKAVQKWEYSQVVVDYDDKIGWGLSWDTKKREPLNVFLQRMGEAGWELVDHR